MNTTQLEKDSKNLQVNLNLVRTLLGFSIKDLAKVCNLSAQSLSNLENQKVKMTIGNYLQIIFPICKTMVLSDEIIALFIFYILRKYEDKDYDENIEKINIIKYAKKGGADINTIQELSKKIGLNNLIKQMDEEAKNTKLSPASQNLIFKLIY